MLFIILFLVSKNGVYWLTVGRTALTVNSLITAMRQDVIGIK